MQTTMTIEHFAGHIYSVMKLSEGVTVDKHGKLVTITVTVEDNGGCYLGYVGEKFTGLIAYFIPNEDEVTGYLWVRPEPSISWSMEMCQLVRQTHICEFLHGLQEAYGGEIERGATTIHAENFPSIWSGRSEDGNDSASQK